MEDAFTILTNPATYRSIIGNYRLQLEKKNQLREREIATLDIDEFSDRLAREIADLKFQFSHPIQKRLKVSYRKKLLYTYNCKDLILQKALLSIIVDPFLKISSPNLFSYLPGRNYKQPVNKFLEYLKKNQNKKNALWIYRTDIRHYYEEIPMNDNALIWKKLNIFLDQLNWKHHMEYIKSLYFQALRPVYRSIDNFLTQNCYGIPYGAPLSGLISNLYLTELDFKISKIQDIFYVRYCDDILIAHPKKEIVKNAIEIIYHDMNELGLTISTMKEKKIYFTQSGIPSPDVHFRGTSAFHFLGMIVRADKNLHASHRRTHQFLMFYKKLIDEIASGNAGEALEDRGTEICDAINSNFIIDSEKKQSANLKEVILRSSCHQFLKQLDLQIALWIAESLSGIKGHRAFRKIPYKKIREVWGLASLLMMRNRMTK